MAAFKFCLVAFVATFLAHAQNVTEFCSTRKTGVYCSPSTRFQKIHCPSGNFLTCPKYPTEVCQERGLLHNTSGIARCVPWLNDAAVASFCKAKHTGTYCWGDPINNIRIQCPTGLVYKCEDEFYGLPTSKTCYMKSNYSASCKLGGQPDNGGGGNTAGGVNCSAIAITFVSTVTKTQIQTQPPQIITQTQVETPPAQTYAYTATFDHTVTVTDTLYQQCPVTKSHIVYVTVPTYIVETSTVYEVSTPTPILTRFEPPTPVPVNLSSPLPFTSLTPVVSSSMSSTLPVTSILPISSSSPVVASTFLPPTMTTRKPSARPSTTTANGGGGGAADVTVLPVVDPTDCSNNDGSTLLRPWEVLPGANFTYVLTPNKVTEYQAVSICRSMGGRIAWISSVDEHWWLGGKICAPVWYRTWNGDSYDTQDVVNGCIALYPGGTTNSPPGDCQALLYGLCKV